GVALLTPASVAWADRTTATSRVNGVTYWSSPLGSGMAALKRRNASSISDLVHCGSSPASAVWSAATCWGSGRFTAGGGLGLRERGVTARGAGLPGRLWPCFRGAGRTGLRTVLRAIVPV